MHEALEIYLTSFAKEFYSNKLIDEEEFEQKIFNFAMNYYHDYEGADLLTKNIAHLKYTEVQYDKVEEFAPEITFKKIMNRALKKEYFKTKSKKMSLARSRKIYRNIYMV